SPGDVSYSNNWPHEPLTGNKPSSSILMWSMFSVVLMIGGILFLSWFHARSEDGEEHAGDLPSKDPMMNQRITPSMRATLKYYWVVAALFILQVSLGAITAHYGVEGQAFFGFNLSEYLPYAVSRTWHLQLSILWIATSWLATGLFFVPVIAGFEPKYQKLGVNILFVALVIVVGGSLAGQWFSVMQKMGLDASFWFGHQGYEYVELGRFWQILLFAGLGIWLFLMGRGLVPAIKKAKEQKALLILFLISAAAIGLFYGAGLMYGQRSHLSMAEYWRWWVVHLWVEGFFEVFATVIISFLFARLGIVKSQTATKAALASSTIFLFGGILGTFHHLYFSGTPTAVMALGASFSALEIAPLSLLGFEAYSYYKQSKKGKWLTAYKWPIYYFIAVAFWNGLGAGIFGFLINPPIALYYMQGLNLTPVHGHTALFGVYGMLGIGLVLFALRAMNPELAWPEKIMKWAFWGLNIGLLAMTCISILPIGIAQTVASVDTGLWYARSAEFLQQNIFQQIRWSRVLGDVIFTTGLLSFAYFIFQVSKELLKKKQ
ncbi:MAG: cbb3-type cytochrome c oxidase subunit I, partial [Cytophagales bacterium]|nr:cbb3-type cytochrome c oxidase subunit I [Cytophagales bacterium]